MMVCQRGLLGFSYGEYFRTLAMIFKKMMFITPIQSLQRDPCYTNLSRTRTRELDLVRSAAFLRRGRRNKIYK